MARPGARRAGRYGGRVPTCAARRSYFPEEVLPLVEKAYKSGKLSGQSYALLLDRVLVGSGKPQVYGTQAKRIEEWSGGEPVLEPIKDEANVDKRRTELGLSPLSEYREMLKRLYFPQDKGKP